jgi:hypothetical protein
MALLDAGPTGRAALRGPGAARPGGPLVSPPLVLLAVLGTWALVPSVAAPPKVVWGLTVVLLGLVLNAVAWHRHRVRWTAPTLLLGLSLACAAVSSGHDGTLLELVPALLTGALLVGCCALAAACDPGDVPVLVRGVVLLALAEAAVAAASSLLGLAAPWGYLGRSGSTFGTNDLLPALAGRATGTMAHPIPLGTLLAVAAVLSLTAAHGWSRPVRLLAAVACTGGVLLSGSRSAALALAVALVCTLVVPGVVRLAPVWRCVGVLAGAAAVVAVDVTSLRAVSSLEGTGSLTHRLGALDAAGRLLDRPLVESLLGSGTGSLQRLFAQGYLQTDGFFAVDNQFVTTLALGGLLGVLALGAAVVVGLLRGDRATRPAALVVVVLFFSFDVLQWNATAVLLAVLLGLRRHERTRTEAAPAVR